MNRDLKSLGPLGAAAARVLSREIALDEALANAGNLASDPALVLALLDETIEQKEDPAGAYTVGELMLASMGASADSKAKGLLAMKVAIVLSLLRPEDNQRQCRRIALHLEALRELSAAEGPDMLGPLLYNVGNAYRDASTMDSAVRLRNAIAYYESAFNLVGDNSAVRPPIIQNLGVSYIERTDGNRLTLLAEALSFFKQASTLQPIDKDAPFDEETAYAQLQVNFGLLRANSEFVRREQEAKLNEVSLAIHNCLENSATIECEIRTLRKSAVNTDRLKRSIDLALEYLTFRLDPTSPSLPPIGLRFIETLATELDDPVLNLKCQLYYSDWSQRAGRMPEAIAKLDAALALSPSVTPWYLRFEALRRIAQYRARLRDFDSAIAQGRRALTIAKEVDSAADEYDAAMELAAHSYNCFVLLGKIEYCEDAAVVFAQALAVARRLHDPKLTMKALHLLAVAQVPHATHEKLKSSRGQMEQALDLAKKTKSEAEYAAILADLKKISADPSVDELPSSDNALEEAYSTATRAGDHRTAARIAWDFGKSYKVHGPGFRSRLFHESRIEDEYLTLSAMWYERAVHHVESLRSEMRDPHERIELLGTWRSLYHGAVGALSVSGSLDDAIVRSDGLRARILGDIMAARDSDSEVLPPHFGVPWRRAQAGLLGRQAEQVIRPDAASVDELKKASLARDTLLFEIRAGIPGFTESFPTPKPTLSAVMHELESEPDMAVVVFGHNSVGVACYLLHPSLGTSGVELIWTNLFGIWDDPNAEAHIPGPSFHFACDAGSKYSSESDKAARSYGVLGKIDEVMNGAWHELFSRVYEKLLALGVKRLVLLPPRSHRLCPLAAINYSNGRTRYLIDDFELTVAPSLVVWLACRRRAKTRSFNSNLAAFVDPTSDLPFARVEGTAVARLFHGHGIVFEGQHATAASIYALEPTGYLHFACHGTFDMAKSMKAGFAGALESALWLAPGRGRATRTFRGFEYDPVTSVELQGFFLDQTRLVVLSACSAGMTEFTMINRGDEQLGLAAALLMAGSAGVIASLWQVDDAATAILMQRFYQGLIVETRRPAQALRDAQLHVRDLSVAAAISILSDFRDKLNVGARQAVSLRLAIEDLEHKSKDERPYTDPYYWAAFFLWGD